jgi:hypothetical protein
MQPEDETPTGARSGAPASDRSAPGSRSGPGRSGQPRTAPSPTRATPGRWGGSPYDQPADPAFDEPGEEVDERDRRVRVAAISSSARPDVIDPVRTADPGADGPDTLGPHRPAGRPGSERVYVSLGQTSLVHWKLIAVVAAFGLLLGVAFGVKRPPKFSAEARLIVGKNLTITNIAAAAGLPAAEETFAAEYARLVSTESVTTQVAKLLKVPSYTGTMSATPIANSNIVRLDTTAATEAAALAQANAGSAALLDVVNQINQASQQTTSQLLDQYNTLQEDIQTQENNVANVQAQLNITTSNAGNQSTIAALRAKEVPLNAKISTDELQASAVEAQYQAQYSPVASAAEVIGSAGPALSAGSDKKKFLEIGAVGGIVAGAVIGLAMAATIDLTGAYGRLRRRAARNRSGDRPGSRF